MNKVVDITSKRERWNEAVQCSNISAAVSTHGRLSLRIGDEAVVLDFMDAALLLGAISREYDGIV